jgi:choline kinase
MKAIILAAGRGSRMGLLTHEQPKCRTVFHGKSLIEWQLEALRGAGINQIAIVRGYLAETFDFDVTYFTNERWISTNMVMSLAMAADWLRSDECLVSYSDIVYSADAVKRLMSSDGDIAITYDPDWLNLWQLRFEDPLSDAETFRLLDDKVVEIGNRAQSLAEIQGQFMGLLKFSPEGWDRVESFLSESSPDIRDKMDMTRLLQNMIQKNVNVIAKPIGDLWFEVDSEEDLLKYENFLRGTNSIWD